MGVESITMSNYKPLPHVSVHVRTCMCIIRVQVIGSKLAELDSLIHQLLRIEERLTPTPGADSPSPEDSTLPSLSLLLSKLTQTVWPALAVVGGLDSGFCLGRPCRVKGGGAGEELEALVVSIPDSELSVVVEERVTSLTLQKVKRYDCTGTA